MRIGNLTIGLSLALLMLNGCAILPGYSMRNKEVNRFLGRTEHDLIRKYGRPATVQPDGKGGKTLVFELNWEETIQEPARASTDSSGRLNYQGTYTRTEYHSEERIFVLDEKGKVIQAKWTW